MEVNAGLSSLGMIEGAHGLSVRKQPAINSIDVLVVEQRPAVRQTRIHLQVNAIVALGPVF
jgi:hypothetical protein